MEFKNEIEEVIKARYSVRNYQEKEIDVDLLQKILEYAASIKGPFSEKVRFELVNTTKIKSNGGKIGTYGVIKGAPTYLLGFVEQGQKHLEQLGYVFEKLILFCTSLGLGTCWLGGTFNKANLLKNIHINQDEILPAITPVGYEKNKGHFIDSVIKVVAGSSKRKPWSEIFFYGQFGNPLSHEQAGKYSSPLEMVRIAPSASNKQPWRIVMEDSKFHFYLKSDKSYSKALGFNIQRIDMGIAMCHFELAAQEQGLKGYWQSNEVNGDTDLMEYLITWIQQ